jgi:hypothetical protein
VRLWDMAGHYLRLKVVDIVLQLFEL